MLVIKSVVNLSSSYSKLGRCLNVSIGRYIYINYSKFRINIFNITLLFVALEVD